MKRSILKFALLASSACLFTGAAHAENFNIPAGDLESALNVYTAQTGAALLVSNDAIKGIRSKGARGTLTDDAALTNILSGTGFTMRRQSSGAITIVPSQSSDNQITPLQLAQASPNTGRIEEVLVTARKREEAVENIPISITALSAEDLKSFGVRNFSDLEGIVPGLNLSGGGNGVKKDGNAFIRGVGQRETKVTLDPAVAIYIDGIYIGRAAGALLDVVDTESIQVLRGPQGTLFGRNATGGAISVSLKKPSNEWEAQVSANIGNYGRRDISGTINLPFIEDRVMGRLTLASINSNGFFTNIVDNTKWGGDNRVTGIAQLRILPTDRITIDVLGERTRIRETPRPQHCAFIRDSGFHTAQSDVISFTAPTQTGEFERLCRESAALPPSQFASDAAIGGDFVPKARYWVDTSTIGLTGTWDIGNVGPISGLTAKTISAWRKTQQIADEDLDAIPAPSLTRIQPDFDRTIQLSQEVQFSGKTLNDRLFFSTGFYFFKEKTPQSDLYLSAGISPEFPDVFGPGSGLYGLQLAEAAHERLQTNNHSYAWYGQADIDITSEIQASAGIRWTSETHWSRYSKAYVRNTSVVSGYLTGIAQGALQIYVYDTPGVAPILDWKFGTPVYSIRTLSNGDQQVIQPPTFVPGRMAGDELSTTDSAWTPMFSVKYKANDHLLEQLSLDQAMLYATYSQGFHSGGVTAGAVDYDRGPFSTLNVVANTNIPCPQNRTSCTFVTLPNDGYGTADPRIFKPEKVTNYEIGMKFAALDRRLQGNLAAFYMDYTDMQVTATASRLGIPIPFIDNVGSSIIKGVEAEFIVLPTPEWKMTFTGSYTDANIQEWNSEIILLDLVTGAPTGNVRYIDRSDEPLPRVPRWQFFAASEYNIALPGGSRITPSVGVRFTSAIYNGFDRGSFIYTRGGHYWTDGMMPNPNDPMGPFIPGDPLITPSASSYKALDSKPTTFVDARLSWISEDGKMEAALWGKNLTNVDDYLVGSIPLVDVTGASGVVYGTPRTFGLTFTYHFGE